jgi:hypothetical protein
MFKNNMKYIMGIDQYGETYHNLGKYPRKGFLKRLGYKKADKMHKDKKDGSVVHCGYVIGRNWINLYEVKPIEIKR